MSVIEKPVSSRFRLENQEPGRLAAHAHALDFLRKGKDIRPEYVNAATCSLHDGVYDDETPLDVAVDRLLDDVL